MKKFCIIWNPNHHLPPTVRFSTVERAEEAAEIMANRFGDPFYVCEAKVKFLRPRAKKKVLR